METPLTKTCTKCGLLKELEEFNRNRYGKHGRYSQCRKCWSFMQATRRLANLDKANAQHKASRARSKKNLLGWAGIKWRSIQERTVNGKWPRWKERRTRPYLIRGTRLEMTKEQFIRFCAENWNTVEEIRAVGGIPSIDRKDDNGHYSIDNIQIIPMRENCRKAAQMVNAKRKLPAPVVAV